MVALCVANIKTMAARHCQLQRLVGRRVPELVTIVLFDGTSVLRAVPSRCKR
jgi:hypothetical protein